MGGRRQPKKARPGDAEIRSRLERLRTRGAWREYVTEALRVTQDPSRSPRTPHFLEAADRALAAALQAGDLDAVAELDRSLATHIPDRPLVALARGVAALRQGRPEDARALLVHALAPCGECLAPPAGVVERLLDLCPAPKGGPTRSAATRGAGDLTRLRDALGRAAASRRLSGDRRAPAPDNLYARAVSSLAQALAKAPLPHVALATAAVELCDRAPVGAPGEPARAVAALAWRLAAVTGDVALLRRSRHNPFAVRPNEVLEGPHYVRLGALLAADAPGPLATYLQQRLRRAVRDLAEAACNNGEALDDLLAVSGDLFSDLVEPPEPGAPADWRDRMARHRAAHACFRANEPDDFVATMTELSRQAKGESDLVTLWALEMAARKEQANASTQRFDETDTLDERQPEEEVLLRLAEIAPALGQRIDATQRAGVARVLRNTLATHLPGVGLGLGVTTVATALLQHLPADPLLLAIALAGSVVAGEARQAKAIRQRIASRGPSALEGTDEVQALFEMIGEEDMSTIVAILDGVRPLFAAPVWPALMEEVARGVAQTVVNVLTEPSLRLREAALLRTDLATLAPRLGGLAAYEAAAVILTLHLDTDLARGQATLDAYRVRFPSYKAAARLLHLFVEVAPDRSELWLQRLASHTATTVALIGPRWEDWLPDLGLLVACASGTGAGGELQRRISAMASRPEVPPQARELLKEAARVLRSTAQTRPSRAPRGRRPTETGRRHDG